MRPIKEFDGIKIERAKNGFIVHYKDFEGDEERWYKWTISDEKGDALRTNALLLYTIIDVLSLQPNKLDGRMCLKLQRYDHKKEDYIDAEDIF